MAILVIPVANDSPNFRQRTALDGRDYLLTLVHNQRLGRWFMSIADQDGVPIAQGLRVVTNYPLLLTVLDRRRPPGEIYAIDLQGSNELPIEELNNASRDPGLRELGARFRLVYFDAEEVGA